VLRGIGEGKENREAIESDKGTSARGKRTKKAWLRQDKVPSKFGREEELKQNLLKVADRSTM